jgi:hypothetical protein
VAGISVSQHLRVPWYFLLLVEYIKMYWCTKADGTLKAHILDPKGFYFCVVGTAHSLLNSDPCL